MRTPVGHAVVVDYGALHQHHIGASSLKGHFKAGRQIATPLPRPRPPPRGQAFIRSSISAATLLSHLITAVLSFCLPGRARRSGTKGELMVTIRTGICWFGWCWRSLLRREHSSTHLHEDDGLLHVLLAAGRPRRSRPLWTRRPKGTVGALLTFSS